MNARDKLEFLKEQEKLPRFPLSEGLTLSLLLPHHILTPELQQPIPFLSCAAFMHYFVDPSLRSELQQPGYTPAGTERFQFKSNDPQLKAVHAPLLMYRLTHNTAMLLTELLHQLPFDAQRAFPNGTDSLISPDFVLQFAKSHPSVMQPLTATRRNFLIRVQAVCNVFYPEATREELPLPPDCAPLVEAAEQEFRSWLSAYTSVGPAMFRVPSSPVIDTASKKRSRSSARDPSDLIEELRQSLSRQRTQLQEATARQSKYIADLEKSHIMREEVLRALKKVAAAPSQKLARLTRLCDELDAFQVPLPNEDLTEQEQQMLRVLQQLNSFQEFFAS